MQQKIASLNADAARIECEQAALRSGTGASAAQSFAEAATHASALWAAASHAEREELLRCFVERIEVDVAEGLVRMAVRRVSPMLAS